MRTVEEIKESLTDMDQAEAFSGKPSHVDQKLRSAVIDLTEHVQDLQRRLEEMGQAIRSV